MLTIRREQMHALAAPFLEQFIGRGLELVKTHFESQYSLLGEAIVRGAVLHAIERAESYGIFADRDVLYWLALMFVFGRDFDRHLDWAAAAIGSAGHGPAYRMSRLQSLSLGHQHEGAGYCAHAPEAGSA